MLSVCLVLTLAQAPVDAPPSDAPTAPVLAPESPIAVEPEPLPTHPPADPKKLPRILLTGGAGVAGAAVGLGAMLFFADARTRVNSSGGSFDTVFSTAALSGVLVAGLGLAVHQALGGRGEAALAALASIGCMLLTGLAVGTAQVDQTTGMVMVAAIGALPAAISVTAILEATGSLGSGRVRAW
jgi:hypothetical protein